MIRYDWIVPPPPPPPPHPLHNPKHYTIVMPSPISTVFFTINMYRAPCIKKSKRLAWYSIRFTVILDV